MPYATVQDMKDRFDAEMLKQVTDPTSQTIDETKVAQALQDASSLIDGYLQSKYELPLASVPEILKLFACNIAMYDLLVLRPLGDIEDQRKRRDDATGFLAKVAEGKIQLGLSSDDKPAKPAEGPQVVSAPRQFSRDSLRDL